MFSQSAYLEYALPRVHLRSTTNIAFDIRLTSGMQTALLVYSRSSQYNDFVSMHLDNGTLVASFNFGHITTTLRSAAAVATGDFVSVNIQRFLKSISLSVSFLVLGFTLDRFSFITAVWQSRCYGHIEFDFNRIMTSLHLCPV